MTETDVLYECKENNLTVKFSKNSKKYYIFCDEFRIIINNESQNGFDSLNEAITVSKILFHDIFSEDNINYYFDYLDFSK